jgi:hypothetical protein
MLSNNHIIQSLCAKILTSMASTRLLLSMVEEARGLCVQVEAAPDCSKALKLVEILTRAAYLCDHIDDAFPHENSKPVVVMSLSLRETLRQAQALALTLSIQS